MGRFRGRTLILVALAAAAGVVLFLVNPEESHWFPRCPSNWLTGLYCPGCGTLRALHHLLRGDVAAACSYNVAAVTALPIVLYCGASLWRVRRGGSPLPGYDRLSRSGWWIAGILVVYAVLRNLPWPPFAWLAPG